MFNRGTLGHKAADFLVVPGHTEVHQGNSQGWMKVGTVIDSNEEGLTYLNNDGKDRRMTWQEFVDAGYHLHFPDGSFPL